MYVDVYTYIFEVMQTNLHITILIDDYIPKYLLS